MHLDAPVQERTSVFLQEKKAMHSGCHDSFDDMEVVSVYPHLRGTHFEMAARSETD